MASLHQSLAPTPTYQEISDVSIAATLLEVRHLQGQLEDLLEQLECNLHWLGEPSTSEEVFAMKERIIAIGMEAQHEFDSYDEHVQHQADDLAHRQANAD